MFAPPRLPYPPPPATSDFLFICPDWPENLLKQHKKTWLPMMKMIMLRSITGDVKRPLSTTESLVVGATKKQSLEQPVRLAFCLVWGVCYVRHKTTGPARWTLPDRWVN